MAERSSLLPSFVRSRYTARLGFALALAIVVVVASGAVISQQTQSNLQEDVRQDLLTVSETRADQLDAWMDSVTGHARTSSQLGAVQSGDTDRINDRLSEMVDGGEVPDGVVAVHYLDTSAGEFTASSDASFVGVDPADQGAAFAENPPSFDGPDDVHVTEPFEVPVADHPIIAVLTPVPDSDGVLVYMTDLEARTEALSSTRGETFTVVVDGEGQYVAHPEVSKIGSEHEGEVMTGEFMETEREDGTMLMASTAMESRDWVVMSHSPAEQAYALGDQINSDLIGIILLAVINLGLVGVTIGNGTAISLQRLADRAETMADGDLDVDLRKTRDDEIGSLYDSFDRMRTSLRSKIREAEQAREDAEQAREDAEREREEARDISEQLQRRAEEYGDVLSAVADGDLTARATTDVDNDAMAEIATAINEAISDLEATIANTQSFAENVRDSSRDVGDSADTVSQASEQVRTSIREIYEGASEQSEELNDAAGEMENLSATAQQVASSAQQVATTSQRAAEVGEDGREAAQEAIEGMNAIEDETDATVREINELHGELNEIGDIVQLITDIADQTNILALNASIEAARAGGSAGDAGDGFAVVADEVKALAEETKEAASDIEARIERIQSQAGETVETMETTQRRIDDGVETVEEAVEALERIVEYTEELDSGIQEIDDATAEQATTAQEVMETIDHLTAISEQTATEANTVAEAADEQTDSIEAVSENAESLRARAEELTHLLERFDADAARAAGAKESAAPTDD